jgi:D-glycero-alpha-D-manno-heptose-7-phosphate kinase
MSGRERCTRASAPVRLDFAGGWTDVPPFSTTEGGLVVGAAIGLRVHATVRSEPAPEAVTRVRIVSDDIGETIDADSAATLPAGGGLALLSAALRRYPLPRGGELRTRSEVPPGSGLGSSGALDVAMVAALLAARNEAGTPVEIAHRAWQVEAGDAGIPGGKQDQYLAALGGFQQLRFRDPEVIAEPLSLDPAVREGLANALLLCYTGRSRLSGNTIARVIAAYERGEPAVTRALFGIRESAQLMGAALRAGDLARIGALLDDNWRHQQALDPVMRTPEMAALERAIRGAGGLGGKAAGSGAGGCMFFVVADPARAAAAARAAGAELLPVSWSPEGVMPC